MSVEFRSEIDRGPVNQNAIIEEFISNGAIDKWAPVVFVAPPAGEDEPRVQTTTNLADPLVAGVAVGGEQGDETVTQAVSAAGKKVKVVTHGKAKVKVNTTTVAIGDGLVTSATVERAETADFSSVDAMVANINAAIAALAAVFATALETSATAGDIIECYVRRAAGGTD